MQTNTPQSAIKTAAETVLKAKQDLASILSHPENNMVALGLEHDMNRMLNKLNALSGAAVVKDDAEQFPPVTNFMGEAITPIKELKKEDITPGDEDKEIFINKVDKLYSQFDTIAPDGILNSYTTPEDQLVLRGVAKRAGVENFDEAELNIPFIEKIQEAMKEKAGSEAKQKEIDDALANQQKLAELTTRQTEVNSKVDQLYKDLDEAKDEEANGKNAAEKKAAGLKVKGIEDEITSAEELQITIENDIKALTPTEA